MRRVLIVCYDYPWISSAGVIRTYAFAKNLPRFGWEPVILTAQSCGSKHEHDIEASDGELECRKITAPASKLGVPRRVDRHEALKAKETGARANGRRARWAHWVGKLAVPDGKITWLFPAVRQGLQICCEYRVDACFSVSPRPTAHLVAYRLARYLKIPWVADFALPWSDAYWLAGRPRAATALDKTVEKLVVRSAQHLTVAYTDIGRGLGARYGAACDGKITVIPTGFDEELFKNPNPPNPDRFTIIYPGNHFCEEGRGGEDFVRAIDEWVSSNPDLEEKVEIVFIGKRDEQLLRHRQAMAHPKVVRVEQLMSHRACVEAIRSSHLCVVNTVGNRIPGKVYECMRAEKPILALTDPGSDLDNLTKSYCRGFSIAATDRAVVRCAVDRMLREISVTPPAPVCDHFKDSYSSGHGAQVLAETLSAALRKRQGRIGGEMTAENDGRG